METLKKALAKWENKPDKEDKFIIKPITEQETLKTIQGLKNTKSAGNDFIDASIIKAAGNSLTAPLTLLINKSIETGKFPKNWKISRIIPLQKKTGIIIPKNYRPVSLLVSSSKILEAHIMKQMEHYLQRTGQANPNQHAYKKGHSTTSALLEMSDGWYAGTNEGKLTAIMMIDMSAAFDCVVGKTMTDKMELLNFDKKTLDWMSSYMSSRKQKVIIAGQESKTLATPAGSHREAY